MSNAPRILTLDIETSPNIVHRWSLYGDSPVGINQIVEPQRVLSCAFKWHDKIRVEFRSEHHDGHAAFIARAHELISSADIIVHFNGKRFDMPHLRTEFILAGLDPYPPVQEIDLYQVIKTRFRFPSNKLDYIATRLGVGGKVSHIGHPLWTGCLAGDPASWATMKRYNMNDVVITEGVYDKVQAWMATHPNMNLFGDDTHVTACPRCGSVDYQRRGLMRTATSVYQRFQCQQCGSWFRSSRADGGTTTRAAA